jgi:hypothetical protein
MKSKSRYKPKKLKFSGEESFMVPNEGEKFILAVRDDVDAIDKQNAENIDVAPLEPVSVTNPNVIVADSQVTTPLSVVIPVPNWKSMDCASIQAEISHIEQLMITSRFTQDIRTQYENILAEGRSVYNSTCLNQIEVPPPPDVVPPAPPVITEPTWTSLSCDAMRQEIETLRNQYASGPYKLGRENYENIATYIRNGEKYYTSYCEVRRYPKGLIEGGLGSGSGGKGVAKEEPVDTKTTTTTSQVGTPPITTISTMGTPIIAIESTGVFGKKNPLGLPAGGLSSGSGGGGGAKEEPKKGFNWLWLLLVAGGVYLLTRKK